MDIDEERKEFEEYATLMDWSLTRDISFPAYYADTATNQGWEAWQAAIINDILSAKPLR